MRGIQNPSVYVSNESDVYHRAADCDGCPSVPHLMRRIDASLSGRTECVDCYERRLRETELSTVESPANRSAGPAVGFRDFTVLEDFDEPAVEATDPTLTIP